jgi:hypothetical protein
LAGLVTDRKGFSNRASEDLSRLLSHSLASPNPGQRRAARLGLLIAIISEGTGEFVTSTGYDKERADRRNGMEAEEWPTASALTRAYGHWLAAVNAACRFWFDGSAGYVPDTYRHKRTYQWPYEPAEILKAIRRCQRELGLASEEGSASSDATSRQAPAGGATFPTEWEYREWAFLTRRLAARAGTSCRVPGAHQHRRAFGGYAGAVEAARRVESSFDCRPLPCGGEPFSTQP